MKIILSKTKKTLLIIGGILIISILLNSNVLAATNKNFVDSKKHVFKLYKQDSKEFKNVAYPARGKGATLGKNGCGPTSCAIIASGFGYKDTPKSLVSTKKCFSCYTEIINYFKKKGFTVKYYPSMSDSNVKKALKNGYKIVVMTKKGKIGNYYVGNINHWYTLLDIKGDKVFVGDPLAKRWRMVYFK